MRGLIVKEPYASMIVKGDKKWEIRRRKTNIRGKVYIISNGEIIGSAELVDVIGPFSVEDLMELKEMHKADEKFLREYARGERLFAWVFENPKEFKEKRKVKVPRGAQVWIRVDDSLFMVKCITY